MDNMTDIIEIAAPAADFYTILLRFITNVAAIYILIRLIYYPRHQNTDFMFTFFLFNMVNFIICLLLSSTTLKMGFAFGLFAIFSILRYRTVTIPVREMGYFFMSVAIGIINALAAVKNQPFESASNFPFEMLGANAIIVGLVLILDRKSSLQHQNYKEINYERIDLIVPEKRNEMIKDLSARTGLPIHKVEIVKIDFLRDVARIHAYYLSDESETPYSGSRDDD
jgi:hypothetical protein